MYHMHGINLPNYYEYLKTNLLLFIHLTLHETKSKKKQKQKQKWKRKKKKRKEVDNMTESISNTDFLFVYLFGTWVWSVIPSLKRAKILSKGVPFIFHSQGLA